MKSLSRFFAFWSLVLLTLGGQSGCDRKAGAGPANVEPVRLEEQDYNFRDQGQHIKLSHAFMVVNTSERTLHIRGIKTSCSCTAASPSAETVPPGTNSLVTVTLSTGDMYGPVRKPFIIDFDDTDVGPLVGTISANIVTPIAVFDRNCVDFGNVLVGSGAESTVRIVNTEAADQWQIGAITTSSPVLTAVFDRDRGEVICKLLPTASVGTLLEGITITGAGSKAAVAEHIQVRAEIVPVVASRPRMLSLGELRPGEIVHKDVEIWTVQPTPTTKVTPCQPL